MTPTTESPPTSPPVLARIAGPRGRAVRIWICPACQYDLSGLPAEGLCPECGVERQPGVLQLGGWRDHRHVPFGPRARLRGLILSLVIASFLFPLIYLRTGLSLAGVPPILVFVGAAGAIFAATVFFGGRSPAVGKRPLELEIRPDGVHFSGHVWSKRLVPWERYRVVRLRRVSRGMWSLKVLAPFWQRHLMETIPWQTGFWYVRLAFQGSRRDAALVRRVLRERMDAGRVSRVTSVRRAPRAAPAEGRREPAPPGPPQNQ